MCLSLESFLDSMPPVIGPLQRCYVHHVTASPHRFFVGCSPFVAVRCCYPVFAPDHAAFRSCIGDQLSIVNQSQIIARRRKSFLG